MVKLRAGRNSVLINSCIVHDQTLVGNLKNITFGWQLDGMTWLYCKAEDKKYPHVKFYVNIIVINQELKVVE